MKTDIEDIKFITLDEASLHPILPRRKNGKPFHTETVRRWAINGLRGRKLRTAMIGGSRCTTVTWIYEFAVSEQPENRTTPFPRTHRERRAIRAEREVRKLLGLPPVNGGDQK